MKFTNSLGLVDETPCPGCGWPQCDCLCVANDLIDWQARAKAAEAECARLREQVAALTRECNSREEVQQRLIQERNRAEAQVQDVYDALGADGIVNLGDAVQRLRQQVAALLSEIDEAAELIDQAHRMMDGRGWPGRREAWLESNARQEELPDA